MKWPMVRVDDIKAPSRYSLVGGPFGSNLTTRDYTEEGVPVIRGGNLSFDQKFSFDKFVWVSEEKANRLIQNNAFPGDIIITQRGTLGQVGRIPDDSPFRRFVISQSQMKLTVDASMANPDYVYYVFFSKRYQRLIQNLSITSGVPHINLEILKNIKIPLPPIKVQRRIVSTLSAYDNLIENNRRRIALLEEATRLLYREWFVHLRFPGHEHTPVVDGIPEGWTKGSIADFYDTSSGGTPSRKRPEFYTGDINWVKTKELQNRFILETEEKITNEAIQRSSAKLFPENTVLVAMYGATIGEIGILANESATNQACCALCAKQSPANYAFMYLFLRENKQGLVNLSQGAAQRNISQTIIRSYPMLMPQPGLLNRFTNIIVPLLQQMLNLQLQSERLTQARDLLLPRLMNGEIAA